MTDELLRPACEAAVEVAEAAVAAELPVARSLRPLLGLRRLPDRGLPVVRRVLEEDAVFRATVASATTEDLVGRASWLYLERPEGWEELLAEELSRREELVAADEEAKATADALRRLPVVEEARRRAEAEAASARADVAALKDRLAEERRARRAADTDAGRLRRRVDELVSAAGSSAAATERDALAAEVDRLRSDLVTREVTAPSIPDLAPLQALLADVGGVLERAGREIANWQPAPGGSRASRRPAATGADARRRRAVALPPAVLDDTVEAGEHLVRVAGVIVLVDGYNVTKLGQPELLLPEQRAWLADSVRALAARSGAEVHLVFDGADDAPSAPALGPRRLGVHIRYSEAGVEADDVLLALLAAAPPARPVVVVSSDRKVRDGAARLGASVLTSATFLDVLRR